METRKIREAKLKTQGMYADLDHNDADYLLWVKIAEYMDGETALVIESSSGSGEYVFLALKDEKKNKELIYMMEQDRMFGCYIDDREGFDEDWDSGEYEPAGCHYLAPENVELLESEG